MEMIVVWAVIAFVLSAALTALCKPVALRVGAVARPRADRWHREVIPLLGGAAIAAATILPALVSAASGPSVWVIAGASGFLFLVGLVDDLRAVKPQTKLVAQVVAASAIVAFGLRFQLTGVPILDTLITLVWIVGITNAFNLLDNMDGLAAGIAAIAAGFRMGFVLMDGDLHAAKLAAILLGATLGFLVHNRPPASIFMGDAGSMFIGCFVAGLSLTGGHPYSRGAVSILLIPVLLLLVPIFDTAFVTVTRVMAGRPVSVGGRDHTSHRLVALGLSEQRALVVLYSLAIAGGTVATLSYRFGLSYSAVLVVLLVLAVATLAGFLSRVQVHPDPAPEEIAALPLARVLAHLPVTRQVATVALDLVLIVAAYWTAYLLRFESVPPEAQEPFVRSLPIVLACQLIALFAHRVYQGMWRYTSVGDLVRLVRAVSAGTVAAVVVLVLVYRFEGFSRAVFLLDWLVLCGLLCGSRVSLRVLGELLHPPRPGARRILVYGAGDGGELVLRELRNNPGLDRAVVGFLDDDPGKRSSRIQNHPVLGDLDDLPGILARRRIDEVIVSSPKIAEARTTVLRALCAEHGVELSRAGFALEPLVVGSEGRPGLVADIRRRQRAR